ncbi:hypothetical protein [Anabaena sp. CA = ATCC 33047]|uniref:hypothetical protein n=1 Tax=Anabaena sp. (strain CA / ATCC 33047) TaxID=52271 RepID=UPI000835D0C7|nr:hypothetical protein [Anabaena sp. CA = ATCC 33047]
MENWQFLIQKQGDRSWYALESPNTQIQEGQYRVLARSSLPNTDVEVRVIHLSTQEVPPKRRVQKQLRRTNSDGLMAVIPFTYLKAGIWELRCSGDLMSDMLGKSWQSGVYLQVMSESVDGAERQPDTGENVASISLNSSEFLIAKHSQFLTTDHGQEALIDQPVSPVWFKGETAEQILQNLIDLALPTSANLLEEEKVEHTPPTQPLLPLSLILDKATYITRWGHVLTIQGRVELEPNAQNAQDLLSDNLYALELSIELRSPLSSEILTQIRQTLTDKSLPFTIRSVLDIPADCESKLILADINLCGALTQGGEVTLLASQSFTITADVTELLAVTAAQSRALELANETSTLALPTDEVTTSINLELFNLVKTPTPEKSQLVISPSPNQPLPAQIDKLSLKKLADSRGLQLPKLPENQTDGASADLIAQMLLANAVEQDEAIVTTTPAPINLEQLVITNRRGQILSSSFPYLKRLPSPMPETSDVQVAKDLPQINLPITEVEHPSEFLNGDTQSADNPAVAELEVSPTLELSDDSQVELADNSSRESADDIVSQQPIEVSDNSQVELVENPDQESIDDAVSQQPIPAISYSSPLIRKWMHSQGYSLPELPDTQSHDVPENQTIQDEVPAVSLPYAAVNDHAEIPSVPMETVVAQEPENLEDEQPENIVSESSELVPLSPEAPPVEQIKTPLAWLAEEIVVDDMEEEDVSNSYSSQVENTDITDVFSSPEMVGTLTEPLPIPQLYLPEGELIAGNAVRVRVELPEVSPQVAVKLWVEDCQTRWLLDGPHLLKDLVKSASGGVEVMMQLTIPFGCLEIRIEAIAFNLVTQQESHKVTVLRTVVPPDLPSLQLDELLDL